MKEGNELHGGDQGLNTEYIGYHLLCYASTLSYSHNNSQVATLHTMWRHYNTIIVIN